MSETELMTFGEMQELVENLRIGSAILFNVLQQVYALHEVDEEGTTCNECQGVYPCNTAKILLDNFVETPAEEETPTE